MMDTRKKEEGDKSHSGWQNPYEENSIRSSYASGKLHAAAPVLPCSGDASVSSKASSEGSTTKPAAAASTNEPAHERYQQESKPKRPLTCYNMFFRCERKRILAKMSEAISDGSRPKIDFEELGRLISSRWKETPQDERKKYRNMAALDRQRYERQMEEWREYMGTVINDMVEESDSKKPQGAPERAESVHDDSFHLKSGVVTGSSSDRYGRSSEAIKTAMHYSNTLSGLYGNNPESPGAANRFASVATNQSVLRLPPATPLVDNVFNARLQSLERWRNHDLHGQQRLQQARTMAGPFSVYPLAFNSAGGNLTPSTTQTGSEHERFPADQHTRTSPSSLDRPDRIAQLAAKLGQEGVDIIIRSFK